MAEETAVGTIVLSIGLVLSIATMYAALQIESIPWLAFFVGAAFLPCLGWVEKRIVSAVGADSERDDSPIAS